MNIPIASEAYLKSKAGLVSDIELSIKSAIKRGETKTYILYSSEKLAVDVADELKGYGYTVELCPIDSTLSIEWGAVYG